MDIHEDIYTYEYTHTYIHFYLGQSKISFLRMRNTYRKYAKNISKKERKKNFYTF